MSGFFIEYVYLKTFILYHLYLLNSPKLFNKFTMANADITKYSSIKLDYLFCIIGITALTSWLSLNHQVVLKPIQGEIEYLQY
jgi:hypothetical protein